MTTGMPELGSKISLISKADIRYEGRLFTVDPQECTIALASVRSFGTEDREAQHPIPAQSQVYDYILFRGTDIKDIRIVNNVTQPLNDPAIMQLSVPPSLGTQNFQSHPVLGAMGPQMGQFGGYGNLAGAMGGLNATVGGPAGGLGMAGRDRSMSGGAASTSKPSELINLGGPTTAPSSVLSTTVEPIGGVPLNDHASVLDLIGGSRSTTPVSLGSRKSPTNDQGVQAGGAKRDDKKIIKPIQPPSHRNQQRKHSRERRDSSHADPQQNQNKTAAPKPGHRAVQHQSGQYQGHGQTYHNQHQQGYQNQHQQGYQNQHQQSYHNQHQQGYHNQNNQGYHQGYQNNRSNNQQQSNWINRGQMRGRGRPRPGGFRNNQQMNNKGNNNRTRNTLKFDNDYDFEQANTQFEELRSQLGKLKLDEAGSSSTKSETTGDVDKKDDSGNETGAGEPEQEEEHEVFYDKAKSFFDKISCEAVERAKGKSQRTDWRVERKLNSETFGVAATRRGAYRGRGGYRGMGFRGGYRPNYNKQTQRREPQPSTQTQQQDQGNRTSGSDELNKNQPPVVTLSLADNAETGSTTSATAVEQSSSTQDENNVVQEVIPEPAMAVK